MNNTYDLWKLLKGYEVVVPIIQRDYAQGRKDKEYIRKTFLTEIKTYLCNNEAVTLDFVYGNIEGNRFFPLDGQQRITTLWLIYWYVSFRAGKLASDCETLKKFTYETRSSSGDFCRELCDKMQNIAYEDTKENDRIVGYIKSQTWFYSAWLQDPTVSAMLRTLGGDGTKTNDNIDVIFDNCECGYETIRDRLINHPVIDFELMIIGGEKLPISDDLYIKMNARGKGLTDFENFKADLVSWIQSSVNPDSGLFETLISIGDQQISYKHYYPSQIDNTWTDVFWDSVREILKSEFDGRIDAIYFSFINRFVLNKICIESSMSPAEYAQGKEDAVHKDEKAAFDRLFGTGLRTSSADDSLVKYEGFEVYKRYMSFKSLAEIDYILRTISNTNVIKAIEASIAIKDADEEEVGEANGYTFLPRYKLGKEHILLSTSQKERVYFLAICNYILNCRVFNTFDETNYLRWMRVVRNLTENAAIDNIPAMVTCMRLIKKLSDGMVRFNNDIYECLKQYTGSFTDSQLECQLKEEKEKAEKILSDNAWENKIIEAENFEFFNGTIRFLYRNVTDLDWDDFDKKFETAKILFATSVPVATNKKLLKQFKGFEDIKDKYLFTSVGYHARHKCWKKDILCSDANDLLSKVHFMLMEDGEPLHDNEYQEFLDSGLIGKIVGKSENYKYRYHWHLYWAIHKDYSQTEGVYVSSERKNKNLTLKGLVDAKTITITDSGFNFYQNGYYWGIRVEFEYNSNKYRWYEGWDNANRADKIYRVVNDKESANAFVWVNSSDLLRGIDAFTDWN